jgi:hypothetical protein
MIAQGRVQEVQHPASGAARGDMRLSLSKGSHRLCWRRCGPASPASAAHVHARTPHDALYRDSCRMSCPGGRCGCREVLLQRQCNVLGHAGAGVEEEPRRSSWRCSLRAHVLAPDALRA